MKTPRSPPYHKKVSLRDSKPNFCLMNIYLSEWNCQGCEAQRNALDDSQADRYYQTAE